MTTRELGPLDVQMRKVDEIVSLGSGLDILQAINSLSGYSINLFDSFLQRLTDGYGGILTTKTCAEISSTLARGLLEPVAAQIDPLQLGEAHRAMSIAKRYGALLDTGNLREKAINRLVEDYPAHSFVIDLREAKKLFHNVRRPSALEVTVGSVLHDGLIDPQRKCMICDVGLWWAHPTNKLMRQRRWRMQWKPEPSTNRWIREGIREATDRIRRLLETLPPVPGPCEGDQLIASRLRERSLGTEEFSPRPRRGRSSSSQDRRAA
jgi:hypothetical protein